MTFKCTHFIFHLLGISFKNIVEIISRIIIYFVIQYLLLSYGKFSTLLAANTVHIISCRFSFVFFFNIFNNKAGVENNLLGTKDKNMVPHCPAQKKCDGAVDIPKINRKMHYIHSPQVVGIPILYTDEMEVSGKKQFVFFKDRIQMLYIQ